MLLVVLISKICSTPQFYELLKLYNFIHYLCHNPFKNLLVLFININATKLLTIRVIFKCPDLRLEFR